MKIAVVSWLRGKPIPVQGYGGIERFVEVISMGLASGLGHDVTLIAPPGSKSPCDGVEVIECNNMVEVVNILAALKPDVIHDNTCWDLWSPVRQGLKAPFLSTTHVNHAIGWTKNVVYLSKSQRTQHGIQVERNLNGSPVVYVPFDPRLNTHHVYHPDSDYCLYIGAIAEWKGVDEAAKLAKRLGKALLVAGPAAGEYADKVKSNDNVDMLGEVDGNNKTWLIEGAYAVMCLHNNYGGWQEPGCGVVGEANACGVPVMALDNGCLYELVETGKNGWIGENVEDLFNKVMLQPIISSARVYAQANWSLTDIASEYVSLYNSLLDGNTWG